MPLFERPDGVLLGKLPGFRKVFPYLMPTRTEGYIHDEQKIGDRNFDFRRRRG